MGGPKFAINKLPQNIQLCNYGGQTHKAFTDTIYLCPNETFQLVFIDENQMEPTRVSQWKKNGVAIYGATTNTLTVIDTGLYSVTVHPNAGGNFDIGYLTVKNYFSIYKMPGNIPLSSSFSKLSLCPNESFQLKLVDRSNPISCNLYQWKKNGTNISNATTNILTVADTGSYSIYLGCISCGNITLGNYHVIDSICSTSIVNSTTNSDFTLFPNPANEKLFVQIDSSYNATILICNVLGQIILLRKLVDKLSEIDISSLEGGTYFVSIDGVTTKSRQIIIKIAP